MSPQSESLIPVPCDHGTAAPASAAECKHCFGSGKRYVPRGWTIEDFDRLTQPLRMFRRNDG